VIGCYGISSEHSYIVSVDNLELVKWNYKAIDHFVLEEDNKQLLKGLVQEHSHRAKIKEGGDLIENKGNGLLILLHGPPDVSTAHLHSISHTHTHTLSLFELEDPGLTVTP
jgi:hypothetical protein